ncbi:hypothetical protein [Microcoleus sp. BROC3]
MTSNSYLALIAPGMRIRGQTTQTKSTPTGRGEKIEIVRSHFSQPFT